MKRHISDFNQFSLKEGFNEEPFDPYSEWGDEEGGSVTGYDDLDMNDYVLASFDGNKILAFYKGPQAAMEHFNDLLASMYSSGGGMPTSADFKAMQLRGILIRDLVKKYGVPMEDLKDMPGDMYTLNR